MCSSDLVPILPSQALAWQALYPTPDRDALRLLARFESGNPRHPAVDVRGEDVADLMPLLEGQPVKFEGEEYRVQGGLAAPGSSRPSVVVAALGPQMLRVTGAMADGTSTWCVGPKVLRELTIPTLRQAAADAGRPEPRVVCALPVCVTDDVDASRRRAAQVFAVYDTLPSYKTMKIGRAHV